MPASDAKKAEAASTSSASASASTPAVGKNGYSFDVANLGKKANSFLTDSKYFKKCCKDAFKDVDLDGRADIMVGAFRYAKPSEMKIDAGKAYLFRMGLLDGTGTYSLGDAHASWVGEFEGDEAGYKATSPGDINGDGLSDIIVSGWQLNIPSGGGKVWVLLNP